MLELGLDSSQSVYKACIPSHDIDKHCHFSCYLHGYIKKKRKEKGKTKPKQNLSASFRLSKSVDMRWGPRICIFKSSTGDTVDQQGLKTYILYPTITIIVMVTIILPTASISSSQ